MTEDERAEMVQSWPWWMQALLVLAVFAAFLLFLWIGSTVTFWVADNAPYAYGVVFAACGTAWAATKELS